MLLQLGEHLGFCREGAEVEVHLLALFQIEPFDQRSLAIAHDACPCILGPLVMVAFHRFPRWFQGVEGGYQLVAGGVVFGLLDVEPVRIVPIEVEHISPVK